jgi:hypothetical protein
VPEQATHHSKAMVYNPSKTGLPCSTAQCWQPVIKTATTKTKLVMGTEESKIVSKGKKLLHYTSKYK